MTNEERYESNRSKIQSNYEDNFIWSFNKSARHAGTFRSDNPYLRNLQQASSKQDEDALYELAVKSEAELAQYERERADRRADLEEQRAYDDPMAVVARNRRAGINPDISGAVAGSGSGTGGSSVVAMPSLDTPTDNTTPFSSGSLLMQGFQIASSLIGSIASFGSSVVGSINTLSMLPVLREGVQLANDLTSEQITAQQLTNDSSRLGLITSGLDIINRLSSFITPETSEEDATALMSALGVSGDLIPNLYKGIQQWHTNPKFKAGYEQDKADAIAKEEFNRVFTREVQRKSLALSADLELVEKGLKFAQTDLESKVANILNTDENVTFLADKQQTIWANEMQSAVVEGDAIELKKEQIKRDLSAFKAQLDLVDEGIKQSQSFIDEIFAEAKSRKVIPAGARLIDGVYLSAEEASFFEIERQKILAYEALGSRFLNDANGFMIDTFMRHYFETQLMYPNGETMPLYNKMHPDITSFMKSMFTFDQIRSGSVSSDDVVNSYSGILLELFSILSKVK